MKTKRKLYYLLPCFMMFAIGLFAAVVFKENGGLLALIAWSVAISFMVFAVCAIEVEHLKERIKKLEDANDHLQDSR